MTELFCYRTVQPIDWWFGSLTNDDLVRLALKNRPSGPMLDDLLEFRAQAQRRFRDMGWDGDIVDSPRYFAVPLMDRFALGVVYRQTYNGQCFVASPVPLPHLAESGPNA